MKPDTSIPEPDPPLNDRASVPGRAPLRRLNVFEYNSTVRDLVGTGAPVFSAPRLGYDQAALGSGFVRGASVVLGEDARRLMLSAEDVVEAALANLPALLPCAQAPAGRAEEDACAERFILDFGLRAYRRPLEDRERARLLALYQVHRGPEIAASFPEAIGDLMTAMLEAPEFLYRWEMGPGGPIRDGELVRFGPYELASRLSYLFWGSMPDQALFVAARDGKLATTGQLVEQARRLLADGRAGAAVRDFHHQYVEMAELDQFPKDPAFTSYTPALARALMGETEAFAASVYVGPQADGKLQTLLTSPLAFLDGPLARFYGVPEPAGPGPVSLPANQRAGLFTRAAFLATKADGDTDNPIRRGDAVLRRVLCLSYPEPVDLVIPPVMDPPPNLTTRERYEIHGHDLCAVACHERIVDPIGYAFEHYDAIGAWRTTESGKPVNSHAVSMLPDGTVEFDDAIALSSILARRDDVRACMSRQWLRYLLRREELPAEGPTVASLTALLRDRDDLRELLVALVRTKTFTHRSPSPGEPTP